MGADSRCSPAAGPPMPDRSSTAGDSSAPAATTTRGARTVTRALGRRPGRSIAPRTPAALPSSTSTRSTKRPTMMRAPLLDGVEQVGAVGRLLRAGEVAEAHVARHRRVVPGRVPVAVDASRTTIRDAPRRAASPASGLLYSEQSSLTLIRSQTSSRWRSKASVATSVEPVLLAPTGSRTQSFVRSELVQLMTVPAAQPGAGLQGDVEVGRRGGAPAPVEVLPRPQLELVEVGIGVVAAHLEHDHAEPRRGQLGGYDAAARAGAHDHRVGLDDRVAVRDDRRDRPRSAHVRGRDRTRVAERRPGRVLAGLGIHVRRR